MTLRGFLKLAEPQFPQLGNGDGKHPLVCECFEDSVSENTEYKGLAESAGSEQVPSGRQLLRDERLPLGVSPRSPALLDAIALVTVLQGLPAEPEQGQGEKLGPWTLEEPLTP